MRPITKCIYRVAKAKLQNHQPHLAISRTQTQQNRSRFCCSLLVSCSKTAISTKRMSWSGGDWLCGACQHQNFKKRETCQRCGYPKFGGPDVSTYLMYNRTEVLAGDWYCSAMNCGAHNYASRSNCFRCGALKNDYASSCGGGYRPETGAPPGWKTGDWICNRYGCGVHNYASRTECYKCRTPRDYGAAI